MDSPKSLVSTALILAFLTAQVPVALAEWVSVGTAPGQAGVYDVIIQATYNNVTGTFPLELTVGNTPYALDNLTVEPVYPIPRTQPIHLQYNIKLNGSKDFYMRNNSIALYYASGETLLKSENDVLSLNGDGYWEANVTVPFVGDYRAVVTVVVAKSNGSVYGGQFVTYFTSDEASPGLQITYKTDKEVMVPAETFDVSLEATFEGGLLPGLDIFKANLYGTVEDLEWNPGTQRYEASFTAPTTEGIYLLNVYAEDQNYFSQKKIYVADISKAKSGRCPLGMNVTVGGCTDMEDVRKCVSDYESELIVVTQQQLASCYESASGGIVYGSIICDAQYKGDLDGDKTLDADDLDIMQNMILPLSQNAREDYVKCADYNLDGKVDNNDLTCLSNVVSEKWYGDFHGGICFDAVYDSPLKGDLTGDQFIQEDDGKLLDKLVNASEAGIVMPKLILGAADFDQNGNINQADRTCLNYFIGMELGNPATLLAGGQTIPSSCMAIYGIGNCQGIRGDLNGDLKIDAMDEILIMLANDHQITGYDMNCADVNKDARITTEDVECVKSYTAGDRDAYFICLNCPEDLPAAYQSEYEICGDGYDNNCDGLVDRTAVGAGDACLCNENTPCWMVKDADGGTKPGVDDGNVQVCRKVQWANASTATSGNTSNNGYMWMAPNALTCNSGRQCKDMLCSDSVYKCAYSGVNGWQWYDINQGLPVETDNPNDVPKTCGDTYDNDCNCGDMKCQKKKEGSMFGSSNFWWGAGVGLVGGAICPACAALASLTSSVVGLTSTDPYMQAFTSGFGIGVMVGEAAGTGARALAHSGTGTYNANGDSLALTDAQASDINRVGANKEGFEAFWNGAKSTFGTVSAGNVAWAGSASAWGNIATLGAAGINAMSSSKKYAEETAKWVPQTQNCSSSS